jgi:hypothetical protein
MNGPNVLVVYALRQWPLRATIRDHLYAFERYSGGQTAYLNLAVRRRVPAWARRVKWDLVVFHTSYLATYRWTPDGAPWAACGSRCPRTTSCAPTSSPTLTAAQAIQSKKDTE